ncbi:hypothetical protein GQ55_4G242200 [Panicum hallii var. hallii]|uniref:Uncharacterized protein n=2 Tax=Panicum hallii TaxID=206008 RepID=A0A2T7DZR8_9POAL|nr:hypothetical protein GQ55_4G242200 [Panicum hallii var. hallii]PVH48044.1 hypothetical protein PAHAL_4G226400 [Panicum hallii]
MGRLTSGYGTMLVLGHLMLSTFSVWPALKIQNCDSPNKINSLKKSKSNKNSIY